MASIRRMTQAGNSAAFPPMALSMAARMICGESISQSAASAAESMLTQNSPLLPFRKRIISARVSLFFCLFSCFVISVFPKRVVNAVSVLYYITPQPAASTGLLPRGARGVILAMR